MDILAKTTKKYGEKSNVWEGAGYVIPKEVVGIVL